MAGTMSTEILRGIVVGGMVVGLSLSTAYFPARAGESESGKEAQNSTTPEGEASAASSAEWQSAADQVEEIFQEFFPKAVIEKKGETLHVAYKCKKLQDTNGKTKLTPQLDGVLLDMELRKGPYPGKDMLPKRENELLYVSYLVAPYFPDSNQHLHVKLLFAHNTPEEFVQRLQSAMLKMNQSSDVKKADQTSNSRDGSTSSTTSGTALNTSADGDYVPGNAGATTTSLSVPSDKIDFGEARLSLYTFSDGRFQIKLPGTPASNSRIHKGITFRQYRYDEPQGSYKISYALLQYPVRMAAQDKVLTDLIKNVADSSKGISSNLVSLPWNGYAGRQIDIELPGGKSSRLRVILVRRYLYLIEATGTKAWLKSKAARDVIDSLVIRPELTSGEQRMLQLQELSREAHRLQNEAESAVRNTRPVYDKESEKRYADAKYRRK